MSFQDSSKACEGLGAGFGGVFFAASCARTGSAMNATVNAIPAIHHSFFISSSVAPSTARTMFETYLDARSVFAAREILLPETAGRIAAPFRKQGNPCQIVSSAAHDKLKVANTEAFGVNVGWLLARLVIGIGLLSLIVYSQYFWYRGLWRLSANWGSAALRVAARLFCLALVTVSAIAIVDGMRMGRSHWIPRGNIFPSFVGMWFTCAFFGF